MAFLGVLPEQESFGTQVARGLGGGFGAGLSQAQQFKQQMMLEKQKSHSLANQTKQLEKVKILETGLGTIERMKGLLGASGGWTSDPVKKFQSLIPGSDVQRDRAELETLGRSLIPLVAAGVPVKNQREFEEYSKIITDSSASAAQLEGALSGIQDLLERSIDSEAKPEADSKKPKMKFSASNPEHKQKAAQLFKTYKDKEKVREVLSREFEF